MRHKHVAGATDALRDGLGVLVNSTAAERSKALARSREAG
jgi:hypothetical protein